jgi:protein deglycase
MVAILLADGFEEVEAVTPADFLRRAGLEVRLVGVTGRTVTGGHGITVAADMGLEDLREEPDAVIVPGGGRGAENLAASAGSLDLIRRTHAAGRIVAAICAAPAVVLRKAGVIAGRRVTCYPGLENTLAGATFSEDRVVVDGNVVTSRAPGTAAEFALKLVELLAGKDKADAIRTGTLERQ